MIWPFRRRKPLQALVDLSAYGGWWVAVDEGVVLGAARTSREMLAWIKAARYPRATMFYVPPKDQP